MTAVLLLGGLPLLAWLYLLFGRGGFWRALERDDFGSYSSAVEDWPSVTAIVPARNEADVIAHSVGSLLAQNYPGPFRVILVDDQSDDGTSIAAASLPGASKRLSVINGTPLPSGWTGKLWALSQGIAQAASNKPEYYLLTDADIAHEPANLRQLVERAERGRYALVSLMARLTTETSAERFLIPAFVYFFQMLYPFSWVNDARSRIAAGAGGCMLVRREALEGAGGIESIRREIIDDCALGKRLKTQGPIWLGLTNRARSLRPYTTVAEIGKMISRSAFTQLRHSWLLLAAVVFAMFVIFLLPPLALVFGGPVLSLLSFLTWLLMAISFLPMLSFYRVSPAWSLALPAIACLYIGFTIKSALDFQRGKGGMWKGRAQAMT